MISIYLYMTRRQPESRDVSRDSLYLLYCLPKHTGTSAPLQHGDVLVASSSKTEKQNKRETKRTKEQSEKGNKTKHYLSGGVQPSARRAQLRLTRRGSLSQSSFGTVAGGGTVPKGVVIIGFPGEIPDGWQRVNMALSVGCCVGGISRRREPE
jgi:hypothetical protein